ncbi:MAG: 2-iminoacetate synthase ThiH, partial [Desulfovibrio sp.]|nr:2-iminoacetate synthase ThiH [Desulfovibrio sp.]
MTPFIDYLNSWPASERSHFVDSLSPAKVANVLAKDVLSPKDFLVLLSPAATSELETMARKANALTKQYFGRAVNLFTPLYISDVCTNQCRYCGFNAKNKQKRTHLSVDEAYAEALALHKAGHRHLLLLTGDAPKLSSPSYLCEVVQRIKPLFASIGIEVYALSEEDYALLVAAGVDSMTMFQETYDQKLYAWLHPKGPKSDYHYRLEAPSRAAKAGMRSIGLGALLGLTPFTYDTYATGLHAFWLQHNFPSVDVGLSIPRICPHEGDFEVKHAVDDRHFVQYVMALRLFLPRSSITCSTRESSKMRDHLIPLGVTRVSAGVSTAVGGRATSEGSNTGQFEITDHRSLPEMIEAIRGLGYQAVIKDWEDPSASSAKTA